MERWLRRIAIAFLCAAALEVVSWLAVSAPSPCLIKLSNEEQAAHHYNKEDCPTFLPGPLILLARLDHFIETHDKSIIAGFTIVLAVSTIGLWLATRDLWNET